MNNKKSGGLKWSYLFVILIAVVLLMFAFTDISSSKIKEITQTQVVTLVEENKIEAIYAYDGEGRILLIEGETTLTDVKKFPDLADYKFQYDEAFLNKLWDIVLEHNETTGQVINMQNPPTQSSWLSTLMPIVYILLGLLMLYFVYRMFAKSNNGAMTFGKSKARLTNNVKVRFEDIAGADEEKQELAEIVEFLKNPQKFTELGARIPKGILLVGNPGTGKTLLARAVAGESNVPFLSISGSDFVEMFVGVGASRVRDLFDQAKKSTPCIVFIDEIDAVGRQRGAGLGGGNDEREQTLNQLLVEMDGFEANEGIIVLAATNRSDVLDPALLRPGRFDRQIYVHNPDVKGREGIIKIHAKNKPIDDEVDFTTLARITTGFTGADLENMLNEAAILAARAGRPKILMEDITEGINKVIMGPQKKSLVVTENDKKITAYHESGHAIIGKMLEGCEEIQEVSIIPRGNAAGYTMSRPDNDDNHMSKTKLNDTIAMMMGGRLAEELFIGDISTGASNDIKRATELARKMVTEWGMSDKFGFMSFESEGEIFVGKDYQSKHSYSEQTSADIDAEVKKILDFNYARAKKILKEQENLMHQMSELLLKKDTIYLDEINMLLEGKTTQEVIAHMDEEAKLRVQKQQEVLKQMEKEKKIREIELRVQTAQMYLKNGIISQDDYNLIIKERDNVLASLNNQEQEQPKQEEIKEEVKEEIPQIEQVIETAEIEQKPKKRGRKPKEEKGEQDNGEEN